MLQASGRTSSSRMCYCSAATHLHRSISRRVWPESNRCLCDENTTETLVVILTYWPEHQTVDPMQGRLYSRKMLSTLDAWKKTWCHRKGSKISGNKRSKQHPNNIMKFGWNMMKPTFQYFPIHPQDTISWAVFGPSASWFTSAKAMAKAMASRAMKLFAAARAKIQEPLWRAKYSGKQAACGFVDVFGRCFSQLLELFRTCFLFEKTLYKIIEDSTLFGYPRWKDSWNFTKISPSTIRISPPRSNVGIPSSHGIPSESGQTPQRRTGPWHTMTHDPLSLTWIVLKASFPSQLYSLQQTAYIRGPYLSSHT